MIRLKNVHQERTSLHVQLRLLYQIQQGGGDSLGMKVI